MKEVSLGRYAGPFVSIPYKTFMQSPIGLVPKVGNKTRLIFHLSFDFNGKGSLNSHTPKEWCTVKYNDLDSAVSLCLKLASNNKCTQFNQTVTGNKLNEEIGNELRK